MHVVKLMDNSIEVFLGEWVFKQSIYQLRPKSFLLKDVPEELHDALVLPQVLVALQEEHVLAAVAAKDRQLPRPLLRGYHLGTFSVE